MKGMHPGIGWAGPRLWYDSTLAISTMCVIQDIPHMRLLTMATPCCFYPYSAELSRILISCALLRLCHRIVSVYHLPAAASGLPQPALALNCIGGSSAAAIAKVLR